LIFFLLSFSLLIILPFNFSSSVSFFKGFLSFRLECLYLTPSLLPHPHVHFLKIKTHTKEALLSEVGHIGSPGRHVTAAGGPPLAVKVGVRRQRGLRPTGLDVRGRSGEVVDGVGAAVLHLIGTRQQGFIVI
jgi:hypothetical protein